MVFDEAARERCKAKVNKQALPVKYFPFYVSYKYDWCEDFYLVGFEDGFAALGFESDLKKKNVDVGVSTSYPFELMNPEKKKDTRV